MEDFNLFSFIIAGLIPSAVGVVWHQPKVLGKVIDQTTEPDTISRKKGHKPYVYILNLVFTYKIALYLACIVVHDVPEFATFKHGVYHAFTTTLYLAIPLVVVNYLYENKPFYTSCYMFRIGLLV